MSAHLTTEQLRQHLESETEGDRTPAQSDPLAKAEQLLNERRFERVMRMTALGFAKLTPVEKRNYARWAKHLAQVFAEKASMFHRHIGQEPELPEFLRAR